MKSFLLPLALLVFAATSATGAIVGGVRLEPTMQVDGRTLELTSCGVRDTLWIDHYAAGLYLPQGEKPDAAKDEKRAKAVRLKVINARYLPEKIPEKWRTALKSELAREPMLRVRTWYDRLQDGDQVTFTYAPGEGVKMLVNGRTIVTTPDHAVIDSILNAWAEEDPVTKKLNRLTLEHPCGP